MKALSTAAPQRRYPRRDPGPVPHRHWSPARVSAVIDDAAVLQDCHRQEKIAGFGALLSIRSRDGAPAHRRSRAGERSLGAVSGAIGSCRRGRHRSRRREPPFEQDWQDDRRRAPPCLLWPAKADVKNLRGRTSASGGALAHAPARGLLRAAEAEGNHEGEGLRRSSRRCSLSPRHARRAHLRRTKSVGVVTFPDAQDGQTSYGGRGTRVPRPRRDDRLEPPAARSLRSAPSSSFGSTGRSRTRTPSSSTRSAKEDVAILRVETNLDEISPGARARGRGRAGRPRRLRVWLRRASVSSRSEVDGLRPAVPASAGIIGSRYVRMAR